MPTYRSFFLLAYTTNKGFTVLQKQWITLLVTYNPSFQADSGPQIRWCLSDFWWWSLVGRAQYDTWEALRCLKMFCHFGIDILLISWKLSIVIDGHIPYPLICQEVESFPQILCFGDNSLWRWPNITYSGLTGAYRSFLLVSYTFKQGFEALQKQWMTLLLIYNPSFQTESGPPNQVVFQYFL